MDFIAEESVFGKENFTDLGFHKVIWLFCAAGARVKD